MRITINLSIKKSKARVDGKCPVYARCTMHGKRIEIATGVFLAPEKWDSSKQLIKGREEDIRILNNRLGKVVSKINDIYNQLESTGEVFDIYTLQNRLTKSEPQHYLLNFWNQVIASMEKKVNKGYSLGRIKHYKTTRRRLGEFLEENFSRHDYPLHKVDYRFISSFDVFLKSKFQLGINTISGYHKQFKKVLNEAVSMELISGNPYTTFRIKEISVNRDFLTIKEVQSIENKNISIQRLDAVKDIFVFACYTGLSYSDMAKLTRQHLFLGDDGEEWIVIDRTKTNTRCRVPLLPKAKAILQKYENSPVNGSKGLLLPILSNQRMNGYLKELADICGINKNLSMHVARHTFATSITLANGVPIETVSKMLGHNSLKTTQIYARIVDTKISNDMKKLRRIL